MAGTRRMMIIAGGMLLVSGLEAQVVEPATLGVQVRGSLPQAGLADAAGGNSPGVGASLVLEEDFGDYFEGLHGRAALGADFWFWGNLTKLPGTAGKITAAHLSFEVVKMLRPGGDPVTLGPYVTAGMGVYEWAWSKTDATTQAKVDVRVGHGVGTLGFGWRLTKSLDFEAKALMGKLDPDTTAVAALACVTWRF